jgi:hypothetical protein
MRNIYMALFGRGFIATPCLLFILLFSSMSFAQPVQFSKDSIPVIDGEVVFAVKFDYELSKEEFFRRSYSYLNDQLNPYSGVFLINNEDSTVCRITDYLEISSNPIAVFGMYMTYNMNLTYKDGNCTMFLRNISYMEKGYFEAQEKSQRKLNMPEYSGKDIMIDKNYSRLLMRDASDKITEATVERINEIIKSLDLIFMREK